MFYVYLLQSTVEKEIYIGSTNDMQKRLSEHNQGKGFSTKRYKPWELIYYEAYKTEKLARQREKRLKQHGNSLRELKKRAGIQPAPFFQKVGGDLSSTIFDKSGAGYTLAEVLVAVSVFVILVTSVIGIFVSILKEFQRSIIEREVVDAARILTEFIDNDLRHAQVDLTGNCGITTGVNKPLKVYLAGVSQDQIYFVDGSSVCVRYQLNSNQVERVANAGSGSETPSKLTSPDVTINNLTFTIFDDAYVSLQPRVIFNAEVIPAGGGEPQIQIQRTITHSAVFHDNIIK
jgi:putative endonuclease